MNLSPKPALIRTLFLLSIPALWTTMFSDVRAQSTTDPYHQTLLQQLETDFGLTGGTWLFHNDEQANAASISVYGGSQKSLLSVEEQPFSVVVSLNQPESLVEPWDAGAVMPNQSEVQVGDVVLITFWVRGIEATAGSGYVRSTFQDRTTFESSHYYPFLPIPEWQQIFIPFEISHPNNVNDAIFGMQLGTMSQMLEFGGITGINYGQTVGVADLPQTPLGNYAGQESDAAWRAAANRRIDQHRKADISVTVVDRNGTPIPNAEVTIAMQKHAFRFGSAVSLPVLLGDSPDEEIYRQKLTNLDGEGHGFNAAVLEWGLQWLPWEGHSSEQYTPERMVEAFTLVKEMGMIMRAHSLVWGGWRWLPPDLEANQADSEYLLQRIEDRVSTMLTYPGLAGEIYEWDVVNEPRYETALGNAVAGAPGVPTAADINPYIFKLAEQADPNMRLFVNDFFILSDGGLLVGAQQRYHGIIQELIDSGARLDGIGLQSHMDYPLTSPDRIYAVLDEFAVYGKELHISEYDLEIEDETKAGEYARDFLTTVFSHPAVTGFTLWNFWDPVHWKRNAALFREDWSVKPSGEAIFDLFFNQWWTDESGNTDEDGKWRTRGFLGAYQIEAAYAGITAQLTKTVTAGSNDTVLTLDTVLPAPSVPHASIPLALSAPQVDGEIDDVWSRVPSYALTRVALGEPTTAQDLSASFRLLAVDGSLYALVEVLDDELRNDSADIWWGDDAVEIYLDGDLSRGATYDGVNDAQLVFRWGDDEVIAGPNSVTPHGDIEHQQVRTDNGYRLEVKIPAHAYDLPLLFGAQFGLDVHVIDDDSGDGIDEFGRERKLTWAAAEDNVWTNPSLMGTGATTLDLYIPFVWH